MAPSEIKAWTFTKAPFPKTLKQSTVPLPSELPSTAILVQAKAAALNPVDVQLQNMGLWSLPFLDFPKIPGADFSGEVIYAGRDSGWAVGDEVCGVVVDMRGWGTLADVVYIDTAKAKLNITRKPAGWSWEQAASLGCVWMTAQTSISKVDPWMQAPGASSLRGEKKEERIVVLGGSSATGMYTVHLAAKKGWRVMATCSGKNVDFVRGMGADDVVDYTTQNVAEEVRKFDPGTIIDCVGGTDCIGLADRYVTIVGDKTTRSTMGGSLLYWTHPRMTARWAMGKLGIGKPYDCIVYEPKNEWFEEIHNLEKEKVTLDSTFSFDKLHEAYERLNTGRARGKVVITIP